jgi:hypothetical protein
MTNRKEFQFFPFHLVDQSPWPILASFSVFLMAVSAVMCFHGFEHGGSLLSLGFILTAGVMGLWFRDVITEGRAKSLYSVTSLFDSIVKSTTTIKKEEILEYVDLKSKIFDLNDEQLGYYLSGLIEGDGDIYLPSLGKTILSRILNPRINFTSHTNNLYLYATIQSRLGGIGRFQIVRGNVLRYIIGDVEGIKKIIFLTHNKFKTPKNKRFNQLIDFMNEKYSFNINESILDTSNIFDNSWFTGFVEADGHFGVKYREFKPKVEGISKRSTSKSVSIFFSLDQRAYDRIHFLSFRPIMEEIAQALQCKLNSYTYKIYNFPLNENDGKALSINVSAIGKLKNIVDYFHKFPLLGIKGEDFKDWNLIYNMILCKEHLTDSGRLKIKNLQLNMNKQRTNSRMKTFK